MHGPVVHVGGRPEWTPPSSTGSPWTGQECRGRRWTGSARTSQSLRSVRPA